MSTTAVQRVPIRGRGKAGGAPKAPMPGFIQPCDPTLHERAPTGSGWVYEIKTDGYRAQVHIRAKRVTVYSRSGYDWTDEFAPIAKAAAQLKVREAIIDGEATVLGNTGLPDFQALPVGGHRRRHIGVPRENILQLLPDAVAPTKEELAAYWARVHKRALEYLGRRPLKLVRHVHGTTFYHKGPLPKDIPSSVQ